MKEKQRLAASWFANGGEIPFPSLRSNANGCSAIINLALILYLFASLASLFLLGLDRWLLSFPASHRWWVA